MKIEHVSSEESSTLRGSLEAKENARMPDYPSSNIYEHKKHFYSARQLLDG
jgi:hypothetical protein